MGSTRRIFTFDRVSADGYFSALDGNLNWAVPDDEVDNEGVAQMPDAGTILFGRRTYEMFESFWPKVADGQPMAPDPHRPARQTAAMHAMAVWINEAEKLVFSRTRKEFPWKNSRLLGELEAGEVEALKNQPGKDMIIFGSGSIVSELTTHGLIDEYQFVVNPVLLGNGRSLISGVGQNLKLKLLEAKTYNSGNVRLRYARQN